MAKPVHVSLMQLLRVMHNIEVEGDVVVEIGSDDFDNVLAHLQEQPGKTNQPTDVEDHSFKIGDVGVRRV